MAAALADATKSEAEAKATYEEMMAAKTKEGNALEETRDTLAEDKTYLAELNKGCATKEAEWEERCKLRQEELVALSETIEMLNSDDSLELFKKTLPAPSSASFLQVQESMKQRREGALSVLRSSP